MNILYINHYAGSTAHGMEYRPYYLSREWIKGGHSVSILAASYSHVRANQPDLTALKKAEGVFKTRYFSELIDGINYHWYSTPAYKGNGLGRIRNIWAFLSQVWMDSSSIAKQINPDVVIASSTYPMDIWIAQRIVNSARQDGRSCKLVFEVHDLWPLSPIELNGISPKHPFIRLCQAAENFAYKNSDCVISMLPKVADHMQSHGLDLKKLYIVPNGITLDEWSLEPPALREDIARHIDSEKARGHTIIGYAGSHGTPNALDVMLNAATLLMKDKFSFVLVGDGHEKTALIQQSRALGLQNSVVFFDPIPKAQIPSFLSKIDIAYIGWQKIPIYRFGIAPNKLMDYMMARCVVLHSVEAGNDPVAEAGCGLTVPPADPSAIANGLRQLAGLDKNKRSQMGESGRQFVLDNHSYPVLARRFLDACA